MIDTLVRLLPGARSAMPMLQMLGLMNGSGPEAVRARHAAPAVQRGRRPDAWSGCCDALCDIGGADVPVIFPVHPRTRARMKDHQLQFSGAARDRAR